MQRFDVRFRMIRFYLECYYIIRNWMDDAKIKIYTNNTKKMFNKTMKTYKVTASCII